MNLVNCSSEWYNRSTSINSQGAAVNSPWPDTGKGLPMLPHDTTPTKVCTKCGETKPATTEYFRASKGRYGLRAQCKACGAEQERNRYAANKGREQERSRAYYAANKERKISRERARYATNRERETSRSRAYDAAHPEIGRARFQRRRVRELAAQGAHTPQDIKDQYKRQKGCCYWCGVKVGRTYHVDHIVPLARGGTNWPENIVIACPTCNLSKKDKLPHEWPEGGRLL